MADTGWKTPATLAEDTSVGVLSWTNPQNAKVEDATGYPSTAGYASVADDYQARNSYYLRVDAASMGVPSGATIVGIEVQVKKACDGSAGVNLRDYSARIVRGGTIAGDQKADTTNAWSLFVNPGFAWKSYGGATDLWGLTWIAGDGSDVSDVNHADFGFVISAHCQGGAMPGVMGQADVDAIQIKVYYTASGSTSTSSSTSSTSTSSSTSSTSTSSSTSSTSHSTSSSTSSTSISTSSTSTSHSTSSTSHSTSSTSSSSSTSSTSHSTSSTSSSSSTSSTSSSTSSTSTSSTSTSTSTSTSSTSTSSTSSSTSSTSTSTTTVPVGKDYSRWHEFSLPVDDADLDHLFEPQEYQDVNTSNDVYVDQGATNEYSIFLFKDIAPNNTNRISVTWEGQSNIAPLSVPIYLEIYNRITAIWEELTHNDTDNANTDFTMTGLVGTNLSDYYAPDNTITCRVYQR